jgi:hypothetical protein
MRQIGLWIVQLLKGTKPGANRSEVEINTSVLASIQKEIAELLKRFPLYPEIII